MVDASFLPKGTQELLWVHPLNLDYNEVLARLKTKQFERLLNDGNGMHFTTGLPHVLINDNNKVEAIHECTLLVSSLDFDIDGRSSASMLAIMKTIQSFYFLGKITHLISRKYSALVKAPSVPAPAIAETL